MQFAMSASDFDCVGKNWPRIHASFCWWKIERKSFSKSRLRQSKNRKVFQIDRSRLWFSHCVAERDCRLTRAANSTEARILENFRVDKTIDGVYVTLWTHGDLWFTNVMFSCASDNKTPIDAILVDLQYVRWPPPATDIKCLLHSVTSKCLYEKLPYLLSSPGTE